MLCILLWSLCVYKEFRGISLALAGATQLPRGKKTLFKDGQFYQRLGIEAPKDSLHHISQYTSYTTYLFRCI